MTQLIEVKGLVKHFPISRSGLVVKAVSGISLQIPEGKTLSLVGESGSGKTTTGRCILRLIEPTAGTVHFKGQDVTHMSQRAFRRLRPQMQMVFQDPYDSLDPRMTVERIIAEPLHLWAQQSRAKTRERVQELAAQTGLQEDLLGAYPHQLSGGEQQRVGIARAIATDPGLLVLDEPTSALDPYAHAEIIELLIGLQKQLGMAYLFISHDLMAVRRVSHYVAIMYLGAIVELGTHQQVLRSPQHPYSRALLSSVLYPDPSIRRPSRYSLGGEIPSAIHLPKGCFLHSRCPLTLAECATQRPELADLGDGHKVACFRVTEKDVLGTFDYLVEK